MQNTLEERKGLLQETENGRKKGGTGLAATKRRSSYWNRLSFLDLVQDEINTISNVTHESVSEDTGDVSLDGSNLGESGEDDDVPKKSSPPNNRLISDEQRNVNDETRQENLSRNNERERCSKKKDNKRFRKDSDTVDLLCYLLKWFIMAFN